MVNENDIMQYFNDHSDCFADAEGNFCPIPVMTKEAILEFAKWYKFRLKQDIDKAIDLSLKMHDNCIEEGHVMATKAKILQEITRLK